MSLLKEWLVPIGGALAILYAVYNEIRLRNAQDDNSELRRRLNDKTIEDNNRALSDADLRSKLDKDAGR